MKPPEKDPKAFWSTLRNCYDDPGVDYIPADQMQTLPDLFSARVARSPDKLAYRQYYPDKGEWVDYSWENTQEQVNQWRNMLAQEKLSPGDRVGIRRRNGYNWVLFDLAALSLGLVVVPLYVDDRADNVAYVINNAGIKLLYLEEAEQWSSLSDHFGKLGIVNRVLIETGDDIASLESDDPRVTSLQHWLKNHSGAPVSNQPEIAPDDLATIVYTSGTTGRPKGVMLSHKNISSNICSGLARIPVYPSDRMVSFLPLSHTLERTVGYYLSICAGNEVVYARSIDELAEDLVNQQPTILVSVPRIFERVYGKINAQLQAGSPVKRKLFHKTVDVGWHRFEYEQGRAHWHPKLLLWPLLSKIVASKVQAKLGGNMRFAISGGAPLPPSISKVFIGLGINILQGYGLTETSPIISVNTMEFNNPASIGPPLKDIEVEIGEHDELLSRGDNVMLGYWQNKQATDEIMLPDGWIRTGDQAAIKNGTLYITGRLKEIIVLANGEKVPPADMESAIAEDALFEQTMVIGEQKPYLTAIVVLNESMWNDIKREKEKEEEWKDLNYPVVEEYLLKRIASQISDFPGYAQIHKIIPTLEPWTVDNGLTTPTMKIKRNKIEGNYMDKIQAMYSGH